LFALPISRAKIPSNVSKSALREMEIPASSKRIRCLPEKKKDKPASRAKKKERSVKRFGEMPDAAKNRAALFGNSHLFTNGRNRESMAISFIYYICDCFSIRIKGVKE